MKKTISTGLAVTASILVVLGFFGQDLFNKMGVRSEDLATLHLEQFDLTHFTFDGNQALGQIIWQTFSDYRDSAKEHNLAKLNALSYKLSPTCAEALKGDQAKVAECNTLMDSVAFFTQDFKQEDFVNVAYDNKQAIISTNYIQAVEGADPIKIVLYFAWAGSKPKVAGLRFCFGNESSKDQCVNTTKETRDSNGNGWWDDIEYFLNR